MLFHTTQVSLVRRSNYIFTVKEYFDSFRALNKAFSFCVFLPVQESSTNIFLCVKNAKSAPGPEGSKKLSLFFSVT